MLEIDGIEVINGVNGSETSLIIVDKSIDASSVQRLVETMIETVEPEELWNALNSLEEDATIKVSRKPNILYALDIFDEIDDAFEYAGVDTSLFE